MITEVMAKTEATPEDWEPRGRRNSFGLGSQSRLPRPAALELGIEG